jgi:hypothetical protein
MSARNSEPCFALPALEPPPGGDGRPRSGAPGAGKREVKGKEPERGEDRGGQGF